MMGHSRRKTQRYWKSGREEVKMGGRDVAHFLGPEAEDIGRVAAAVVARAEVESRRVADHRRAYLSGRMVWFKGGM